MLGEIYAEIYGWFSEGVDSAVLKGKGPLGELNR